MKIKFIQKIIDKIRGKKEGKNTSFIKRVKTHYGLKHIYTGIEASQLIARELQEEKPSLICRFGSVELSALNYMLDNLDKKIIKFPEELKTAMSNNAGFFPTTDHMIQRFATELYQIIKNIDIIGVWFLKNEENLLTEPGVNAKLTFLEDLNVLVNEHILTKLTNTKTQEIPFTKYLEGKKVLVIHPFKDSILEQYQKRELLFKDKNILPKFDLTVIKAVQSICNTGGGGKPSIQAGLTP